MVTRILALLSVLVLFAGVGGCSAHSASPSPLSRTTVRISSLKGPTTMGLVKLMSDADAQQSRQDYRVTMHGTPDEIVPLLVKKEADIAAVPSNLAAVLYARTQGAVQVVAINTLGALYVLESGDTINSIADLKGKTVYATGKGASPEYALNFILRKNNLDPARDVTIEWKSEHTELAAMLATDKKAIAVLPQPFVAVVQAQNPTVRTALDLNQEWNKVSQEAALVMGVLVVRKEWAEANSTALAAFLVDYQASTRYTNDNVEGAATLVARYGIVAQPTIAVKAIPGCNITYIAGADMKTKLSGYLKVLFDANPASVGGALPGHDFYYAG